VTFRTKLLIVSSLTVAGAVTVVTGGVLIAARQVFENVDAERQRILLEQFRTQIKVQGAEVSSAVARASSSTLVTRIAAEANRPEPDFGSFYTDAQVLAQNAGLEFLDISRKDLTILSSAHWPVRFGYKNDWICNGCKPNEAFLTKIPLSDGSKATALASIERHSDLLLVGAKRLDAEFMKRLGQAPGVRTLLCTDPGECFSIEGSTTVGTELQNLVRDALRKPQVSRRIGVDAFLAVPLKENGGTFGVLLVGTSLQQQMALERSILYIGLGVAAGGILLGVLLAWWATEHVTRPVNELARGARAVASGQWSAQVNVTSGDEMGELAHAFNKMVGELKEQQNRALQAERVAAWRELARRLAHELKNPLFPLQITVENMQRSRLAGAQEFEEAFLEGTRTVLEEVKNLKAIIGRFSDFSRMPAPHFERIDIAELIRDAVRLYEAQLAQKNIAVHTNMNGAAPTIEADSDQLRRALGNLILNAIDAMPNGGSLTFSVTPLENAIRIAVADTGEGLTEEERSRLFTPYYTTKHYGTGLGLAIVQGVVTDHHGTIAVQSGKGMGASFIMEFPVRQTWGEHA
jgi:two-component system nitrogen regulation sensor histidine kinase NtrY